MTTIAHAPQTPATDEDTAQYRHPRPSAWLVCTALLLVGKLVWFDYQVFSGVLTIVPTAVNVGTVLVLTGWMPFVRPSRRLAAGIALDLLVSCLIFANLLYMRFFDGFVTVPVMLQAGQVGAVHSSIIELLRPRDLFVLFCDVPVLVLAWRRARRREREDALLVQRLRDEQRSRVATVACVATAAACLLGIHAMILVRNSEAQEALEARLSDPLVYRATGLVGFHIYDAARFAADQLSNDQVSALEVRRVRDRFAAAPGPLVPGAPEFGEYRRSNVLVVQLEAFQSFLIDRAVGGQEITPNLNRLASSSAFFENAYHQTASGRTSDAELLAGCSLHPASGGATFSRFAGNNYTCLPEILREKEYSTTSHHAYVASFWNRHHMYPSMGYQRFLTLEDYGHEERLGWSIGDRSFLAQTARQLEDTPEPFYDVAITLTSHHPYDLAHLPRSLPLGDLEGTILGDYLNAAHYVDSAVGRMIAKLRQSGLWEETVVVMYGDHDNAIVEWDQYEELFGHSLTRYEQEHLARRVPLLIHFPDGGQTARIERPVGQIDVAPTLLHVLGVEPQERYQLGTNMFAANQRRVIFRDGGYSDAEHLYVPRTSGTGWCFRHGTERTTDAQNCSAGAEAARSDLLVSDLVLENDLLPKLAKPQGITASGAGPTR